MARQEQPYQAVRRMRKEQNLTLDELAEMVGISSPVLSRIENNQTRITGDHAIKLSRWSGESLKTFYPEEEGEEGDEVSEAHQVAAEG